MDNLLPKAVDCLHCEPLGSPFPIAEHRPRCRDPISPGDGCGRQASERRRRKTAAQLARREFGNVALVKDVSHELTSWMWLERLGRDFRFAMRQITRTPASPSP